MPSCRRVLGTFGRSCLHAVEQSVVGIKSGTHRERLEHCDAALCPSVAYQLAGAKKVQQDLARPQVLERFLDNTEQVELIRACFAGVLMMHLAATCCTLCTLKVGPHTNLLVMLDTGLQSHWDMGAPVTSGGHLWVFASLNL